MLVIQYRHPLHGEQTINCNEIINKKGTLHVVNIHGVTFQIIEADRIMSVNFSKE